MKIVLSGVETNNKGAELMLYAILQEIERKFPEAIVYLDRDKVLDGIKSIKTNLDFRFLPLVNVEKKMRLNSIYHFLHIPFNYLPHQITLGKIDYYIDGSGFKFSDQFNLTEGHVSYLKRLLHTYRMKGARIIFLPQAFGPFENKSSKELMTVLNDYSTVIMPRERISLNYIKETRLVDMNKVKLYTDFTSLVEGVFPSKYEYLRDAVCVIPNRQMIRKGAITLDDYIDFLQSIIAFCKELGKRVYLLNHEGEKDEHLCFQINQRLQEKVDIISKLNAIDVKGLISSAYLVISSRFHGVASALNTCVPCLATSWSHKYSELFNDYQMKDCILPLEDKSKALSLVAKNLQLNNNTNIRKKLSESVPHIMEETRNMWSYIWNL